MQLIQKIVNDARFSETLPEAIQETIRTAYLRAFQFIPGGLCLYGCYDVVFANCCSYCCGFCRAYYGDHYISPGNEDGMRLRPMGKTMKLGWGLSEAQNHG